MEWSPMSTAARRAKLLAELQELDTEDTRTTTLTPAQRIAEVIHSKICRDNHTDVCGWDYGSWDQPAGRYSSRAHYLKTAQAMLAIHHDETTILAILNCL